jgi:hypothetical protein
MMQIKLNDGTGATITIERDITLITIEEYINYLIVPALLGVGFSDELVGKYIVSDILHTQPHLLDCLSD